MTPEQDREARIAHALRKGLRYRSEVFSLRYQLMQALALLTPRGRERWAKIPDPAERARHVPGAQRPLPRHKAPSAERARHVPGAQRGASSPTYAPESEHAP